MFACSGAFFQDLPDSADILITQRNDFRVCDCVVRSAFPALYISQVRSAAGAYDSGAGGDITKALPLAIDQNANRSDEHTSELQSLMRISYAVFCLKKTNHY